MDIPFSPQRAVSQNVQERMHELENRSWHIWGVTPEYICQVALKVSGVVLMAIGAVTLTAVVFGYVALKVVPTALLCIGVGGLLFYVATKISNYRDPNHVKKVREEVVRHYESLQLEGLQDPDDRTKEIRTLIRSIVDEHGWDTIFYYGIPLPAEFERIFRFSAEQMTLPEIIDLYEEATQAYIESGFRFTIPSPTEFHTKLKELTLENCDPKMLVKHNLISERQKETLDGILQRYSRAKENYSQRTAHLQLNGFENGTYEKTKAKLEEKYAAHPAHMKLRRLRDEEASQVSIKFREMDEDERIKQAAAQVEEMQGVGIDDLRANCVRNHLEETRKKVREEFDDYFKDVEKRYASWREEPFRELKRAKEEMNKVLATLRESDEYREAVRIKEYQHQELESYHQTIEELTNELHATI